MMSARYRLSKSLVLAAHKEKLEIILSDVDTGRLVVELLKNKVITEELKESFASLDPDQLESDIKVRYLLHMVCERVGEDEKVYDRLVRVLSRHGGDVRGVCVTMSKALESMRGDGVESDFGVGEVDVPYLVEVLVSCSHKWDAIGIALGLPEYLRDECRDLRDNPSRLSHILTAWISGSYDKAKPATLNVLKKVLPSELVGFPKLVRKLGNFKNRAQASAEISENVLEIEYQSYNTEVSEGKSTLLEVQVSCSGCESYQWSKDGQPLLDGADFSGVSSNILYINRASQGTEGKYSCTVSDGCETVCTAEIKLRVLKFSFEKVNFVRLLDCFKNYNIISKYVYERFSSLDQNYLKQDLTFRYLFQQVLESIIEDSKVYDKLDNVLSELEGILKDFVEIIKSRVDRSMHRPVVKYSLQGDDQHCGNEEAGNCQLKEEDCPHLVHSLLCVGDNWELIGKALTLPQQVIIRGRDLQDNCSRLFHILTAWISGCHDGAKPATMNVLKKVLSDELGSLPKLMRNWNKLSQTQNSVETEVKLLESLTEIGYQSHNTEVPEGKSTLLEVQVSCNGCESYQWNKDGQPLHEGANFLGVSSNILYINGASQSSEGKFSCAISNGGEAVYSDDIRVEVLYSPEKIHLEKHYSLLESEAENSWPPVGNSTFVNLVLIKQSSIKKCNYYTVCGDMDDILESKEVVTYEEIFSEYKEGTVVLVEGRPGSGKTTLVHKVTRDWVKGQALRGAKLVFLVTLHILNFTGRDKSLSDLLEIFFDSEDLKRNIELHLKESAGKGVCFIFDGLDEYQHRNKEESVIYQLIHRKCLRFSNVIVASRPVATKDLKKSRTRRIEVVGFTKSQIYKYVETYPFTSSDLSVSDMVSSLKTYLDQHRNVLHMCYLPVHAAMTCFLFSELGDNIPHTETQIYEQFTIATLLRQRTRSGETKRLKYLKNLCGKEKEDFQKICELAYRMTSKSEQVVSESDISMSFSGITSSVIGLLTVEQASSYYGVDHLYTFHHLTFQEYLAAVHINGLEEDEVKRIILRDGMMKNVIKFYCGLLGAEKSLLIENKVFLHHLLNSSSDYFMENTYNIQCAFESQHVEFCNYVVKDGCLVFYSIVLTAFDFAALGYVISTASQPVSELVFNSCSWDYDGVMALSSTTTKKLEKIKSVCVCNITDSDWSTALNGLLLQLPDLEELEVFHSFSKSDVVNVSMNVKLSNLTTLKVSLPETPASHPEETLKLLTFGSHNIQNVYYHMDEVYNNFASWKKCLCYAFGFQVFVDSDISWVCLHNSDLFSSLCSERFSYCTEVVLVNCGIDDEGAELLASRLNTSVIKNIVLDFNRICDSGAVALSSFVSSCSVLREVCMECNSIGDLGATALASALVHCSSLRRLDLQGNAISDEGAVALAKAAEDKPHLDLYLHNVSITEEGVKKVLQLRGRSKIKSMEFSSSWKAISTAGIDDLRRALKCGCLPALKLTILKCL